MRNGIRRYFNPLTAADRRTLAARLDRHRERLMAEGYELTIAEGQNGLFAAVLVIDEPRGRLGFLEDEGEVAWLGNGTTNLGELGSAVTQNQTKELTRHTEAVRDLDGVNIRG